METLPMLCIAAVVLSLLLTGCAVAPPGTEFRPSSSTSSDECDQRITFFDIEGGSGELCLYNYVGADLYHGETNFFITYDEFCVYICPDAWSECLSDPQYWNEDNDGDKEVVDYKVCRGNTPDLDPILMFWWFDYDFGDYQEMDEATFEFCEYR